MKLQACMFKRTKFSPEETGVAVLDKFDESDVRFIMDEHGEKVEVWSYNLISSPLSYLDTQYTEVGP